MIAEHHGLKVGLTSLRRRFQVSLKGSTLKHLASIAAEVGFSARALRGDVKDLSKISLPTILHWNLNHFVVLTRISNSRRGKVYHIHDPASGTQSYSSAEVSQHFTGVFLELVKSEGFRPQTVRSGLKINQLWSRLDGFWPSFRQVLVLSLILQFVALVTPFFMQIAIDTALPSFDLDFLLVLALGFGGVATIGMAVTWARSLVLIRLGNSLSYQVNVNLFRHLLHLPLPWFERRHVGDIISRFGSTKPISDLLSQGLIASIVDGLLALLTLALMFFYSPSISAIAIASLIVVVMLRIAYFETLKGASINLVTATAKETSAFIETIRGISTIKSFGEEVNRQHFWQQQKADAVNAETRSGQINAGFNAGEQFVMGIERIIFVYVGIRYAMQGVLSVGMLFALQAYRQQFLDASNRLFRQFVNYNLLDLHLSRLADIALSEPESRTKEVAIPCRGGLAARITLRQVRFRYAANEPEVLCGIDLDIQAGEMIALVGASGNGKTTLIKVLMGLLLPTHGEILINGTPLSIYGIIRWRQEIASVSQEDVLFAGTIADNICMFDSDPDDSRIRESAQAANIDIEISQMPMRYDTAVGDMGSVLSGGQKQRIMLARAVYRRPSCLFLDEATAHLDAVNEFQVGKSVKEMSCTRLVIAHRPQTIERADRIFLINDGILRRIEISGSGPSSANITATS